MICRWFRRRPRLTTATAAVPPGYRVYAIGDIHGRADLLRALHRAIVADSATASKDTQLYIVYLGDYVDRGLQSREVIDELLTRPLPGFSPVHLRGNHDQQFLRFLRDPEAAAAWLHFGGEATVISYGVRCERTAAADERICVMGRDLRDAVPDAHVAFLSGLALSWECGDYLFVHAGIHPEKPLADQTERDLLWIRNEFLDWDGELSKIVIHGHTVSERPDLRDHRIGIDTGAFYTNRLTALVLEGSQRRFLMTDMGGLAPRG